LVYIPIVRSLHSYGIGYAMPGLLIVVLPDIGDNLAYKHGLHFCCQEVYPYRNQNKV
jgi:hypothetical protein